MTHIKCPSPETWLDLHELGFSIFPLKTHCKRPAVEWEPYQSRRASPTELEHWGAGNIAYNIGIATGALSGIVVLDLDSVDATEIAAQRGLPRTVEARTPRGRHVYFRHPGYPCGNIGGSDLPGSKLPKGLDVRGDGGYVVGHDSYYIPTAKEAADGKLEGGYHWLQGQSPADLPLADMPGWLASLYHPAIPPNCPTGAPQRPASALKPQSVSRRDTEAISLPAARQRAYGTEVLSAECAKVRETTSGSRNTQLNDAAWKVGRVLAKCGIAVIDAEAMLLDAALACGLDAAEAAKTIKSGLASGQLDPRSDLPANDAPLRDQLGAIVSAADLCRSTPAPREWLLEDWIPVGACTTCFGDGGGGKTLAAMMMAAAVATGRDLWGRKSVQAPTLAFYCEDDQDELNRRQTAINDVLGLDRQALNLCFMQSRFGMNSLLGSVDRASGEFVTNDLFKAIEAKALSTGARLIVLDNINMVFGDNINDPGIVTRFMAMLNGLALTINGAVLLIGHTAKAEGSKFAGAMAWSNASRNRLFLGRPDNQADAARNPDLRHLTREKSNYARVGETLDLVWDRGAFVRPQDASPSTAAQTSGEAIDDRAFLDLLDELTRAQRPLSVKKQAGNYGPRVMATKANYRGKDTERRMERALGRLLTAGIIVASAPLGWRTDSRKDAIGIKRVLAATADESAPALNTRPDVAALLDSLRVRGA